MAGRTGLGHAIEDRIAVAVDPDLPDLLDVAGAFPLLPEGPARSAEVMGESARAGLLQGVPVGVGEHEDVTRPAFLGDDRNQSLGIEFDSGKPGVVGHGVKVPGGSAIVKSCWYQISCSIQTPPASRWSLFRVA